MRLLSLIFGWFFGLLFSILGIASLFYSIRASVSLLLLALMTLPPARDYFYNKTRYSLPRKVRAILTALLVVAAMALTGNEGSRRDEQKAAVALQHRIDEYFQRKPSIIDSISAAVSMSDFESAISRIDQYAYSGDPELSQIKLEIRRTQLLTQLKGVPEADLNRNKDLYGELMRLFPGDAAYQAKFEDYSSRLSKKQEEARRAAEERTRETRMKTARDERIKAQFSAWDGAHRNLTQFIKQSMNDPDSFKHVETVYWDRGDHLVVQETFRGKNAFGGVVKNSVKAKVSLDGQILEIMDQW